MSLLSHSCVTFLLDNNEMGLMIKNSQYIFVKLLTSFDLILDVHLLH